MSDPLSLVSLHSTIRACQKCPLRNTRLHAVPGEGPENPRIMLIGEAPGRNEDMMGRPFCGAAGKKLDILLESNGIKREDVFITSIVKCRPPENRVPTQEEATMCKSHYLFPQIQALKPTFIGLMGKTAVQHVLGEDVPLARMHGKIIERDGQKYVILYHPAAMIYNQSLAQTMKGDFSVLGEK